MKIYISIPISGRNIEDAKEEAASIATSIKEKGHTCVNPFDIVPETDGREPKYSDYIGEDMKHLLECDAIFLSCNWGNSKGCRLEYNAALIYGKTVFKNLKDIPLSIWSDIVRKTHGKICEYTQKK